MVKQVGVLALRLDETMKNQISVKEITHDGSSVVDGFGLGDDRIGRIERRERPARRTHVTVLRAISVNIRARDHTEIVEAHGTIRRAAGALRSRASGTRCLKCGEPTVGTSHESMKYIVGIGVTSRNRAPEIDSQIATRTTCPLIKPCTGSRRIKRCAPSERSTYHAVGDQIGTAVHEVADADSKEVDIGCLAAITAR